MKNNKGFTLVELLAVIVILALVAAIALPSILGVTSNVQDKLYEEKLELIEESAVLYGQDIKSDIVNSAKAISSASGDSAYEGPCESILVGDLVPNYLDSDNTNTCITTTNPTGEGCVVDPNDESAYLDSLEVIIYYKYKRIKAVVNTDGDLTCS